MWVVLFLAGAGWQQHGSTDGIVVETRSVPGSAYESIRVRTETAVPPEVQAEEIWRISGVESVPAHLLRANVLLDESKERRLLYQVVAPPTLAERDYVLEVTRRHDGDVHTLAFTSVDDRRYPAQSERVRMVVRGSCTVEPSEAGGSIVTYEMFTELGGSLPAWMARNAQRDSSVQWMKTMLSRGRHRVSLLLRGPEPAR